MSDTISGQKKSSDEQEWPAVETAYDFVLPSYQFLLTRLEAADSRLTALLTLASTLTLGAPIFAKNVRPEIHFSGPFFMLAVVFFVVGAVVGMVGRAGGSITLPNPMRFYETSLKFQPWEFQKNAIYWAGEAFTENARVVQVKGNIALIVTGAWLLEVLCLLTWMAS